MHSSSSSQRSSLLARGERLAVWLLGHASNVWPFIVFAVVLALSWRALREIRPREFTEALHGLDFGWLSAAAGLTLANIGAMGFYDVVAFRHTKTTWPERWRYGAVCFAWSNFLTLGPLAGPAMRFWLYRSSVDETSQLHEGVLSVALAFGAGLAGWLVAILIAGVTRTSPLALATMALLASLVVTTAGRWIMERTERFASSGGHGFRTIELALVGWTDWLLAALTFVACLRAAGATASLADLTRSFFFGQGIGIASLVPGGFGSSDAFWIAHLPFRRSAAAAVLMAYRLVYYIVPWAIASLVLLTWVTRRAPKRLEMARRLVAGLVGGGGVLIMLSTASPTLYARLALLERYVPLPLVEAGHVAAALAGLLLLVLARGLAKGYRAAFRFTMILLAVAGGSAILKGFDWEEALVLAGLLIATGSQSALFDRPSRGDPWIESSDIALAITAFAVFLLFGTLSHRVGAVPLARWTAIGYRLQAPRFIRTAGSLALAVAAGAIYLLMRPAVRFTRLGATDIERTLRLHAQIGEDTNPLMVATGDKDVFFDDDRGFCLYRTIGPYLVVFSDPVVRSASERAAFLDALFAFAGNLDRRPVFYQVSVSWLPVLHDRGYDFFKLGEEARLPLSRVTLDGHAGKLYRQFLRRAERDGVAFRILQPAELRSRLHELREISDDWLQSKGLSERQFSVGSFDETYLLRFPCAIVEDVTPGGTIRAFANLLEGPDRQEYSVDLMRHRSTGPHVMDFLFTSLFLRAKAQGYREFSLGMAPLASVGAERGAHLRERLARVLFQRGETWYNFQGLRAYKDKFDPDWVPRYMAYQNAWEWPLAIAYVSALTAGGWSELVRQPRETAGSAPSVANADLASGGAGA